MTDPTQFTLELKAKLADLDFPVICETAVKLITQLSSPNTDVDDIVETLRRDQGFVTRVLTIANSAYYWRRRDKITTIKGAILKIGYDIIRDIAITAEYVDMARKCQDRVPQLGRLFAKAFVAAHQTTVLCEAVGLRDADALFTSALLESLGEVALTIHLPEMSAEIARTAHWHGWPYDEAHRYVTGLEPHAMTVLVASVHQLPEELILAPPRWEASSEWAAADRRAAIVHLTNACASNLFEADSTRMGEHFNRLMALATGVLGLPEPTLVSLLTTAFNQALEFGIQVNLGYSYFDPGAPGGNETPRQKLMGGLSECYRKLATSRAYELAYRLYSLPL